MKKFANTAFGVVIAVCVGLYILYVEAMQHRLVTLSVRVRFLEDQQQQMVAYNFQNQSNVEQLATNTFLLATNMHILETRLAELDKSLHAKLGVIASNADGGLRASANKEATLSWFSSLEDRVAHMDAAIQANSEDLAKISRRMPVRRTGGPLTHSEQEVVDSVVDFLAATNKPAVSAP